jgi:hypothetical protein
MSKYKKQELLRQLSDELRLPSPQSPQPSPVIKTRKTNSAEPTKKFQHSTQDFPSLQQQHQHSAAATTVGSVGSRLFAQAFADEQQDQALLRALDSSESKIESVILSESKTGPQLPALSFNYGELPGTEKLTQIVVDFNHQTNQTRVVEIRCPCQHDFLKHGNNIGKVEIFEGNFFKKQFSPLPPPPTPFQSNSQAKTFQTMGGCVGWHQYEYEVSSVNMNGAIPIQTYPRNFDSKLCRECVDYLEDVYFSSDHHSGIGCSDCGQQLNQISELVIGRQPTSEYPWVRCLRCNQSYEDFDDGQGPKCETCNVNIYSREECVEKLLVRDFSLFWTILFILLTDI